MHRTPEKFKEDKNSPVLKRNPKWLFLTTGMSAISVAWIRLLCHTVCLIFSHQLTSDFSIN
jgi:hypothetical protein